jgi:hypothetical protein
LNFRFKELGYQKLDRIERDRPEYKLAMSEVLNDAFASESLNRIGKGEVHDWLNSLQGLKHPIYNVAG